jgi:hypothetical protein
MLSILVVFQVGSSIILLVGAVSLLESSQWIPEHKSGFCHPSIVTTRVSLVATRLFMEGDCAL